MMKPTLRRIEPDDAEDFDQETDTLLRRWAAKRLDVPEDQIAKVLVEVTGGCGEGTCEFTTARAEVDLTDGRVFLGRDQGFGLFIQDIVKMDVRPDGTEVRSWEMWDLFDEDGKAVVQPKPRAPKPAAPTPPPEPSVGAWRVEQTRDDYGRVTNQRTDVLTAHGWVNLLEVIAAYDATRPATNRKP